MTIGMHEPMKKYLLSAAPIESITFGLVVTTVLISNVLPAAALSPVEIQNIARSTTIQITNCSFGSGVIIRKNGNTYTVLTVAHTVRNPNCRITTPDNNKYQIGQIKTFPGGVDLAVFTFNSDRDYPVARLIDNSDRVEVGETIYVSGFPLSSAIKSSAFAFIKGDVVSNPPTQQQGKGYSLIYSNNTLPGQSGGPVWNDRGEVIAIHGQGDIESKSQETINSDVRVKTGYNLGITVNTFTRLAATVGLGGYAPAPLVTKSKAAKDQIASAEVKLKKGDFQGMLSDLDLAISADPQNARAYSLRGNAKNMLGDNSGALSDLDRAIALAPNFAESYFYRGNTKLTLKNNQGAIADYDRAIALNPNSVGSYGNRGMAKSYVNDERGAIADFSRAIAIKPIPEAYFNRGQARLRLGEYREAIADYDRVVTISSNHGNGYFSRGVAKSKLGDDRAAMLDYLKAASLFKEQGKSTEYQDVSKLIRLTTTSMELLKLREQQQKDLRQYNQEQKKRSLQFRESLKNRFPQYLK